MGTWPGLRQENRKFMRYVRIFRRTITSDCLTISSGLFLFSGLFSGSRFGWSFLEFLPQPTGFACIPAHGYSALAKFQRWPRPIIRCIVVLYWASVATSELHSASANLKVADEFTKFRDLSERLFYRLQLLVVFRSVNSDVSVLNLSCDIYWAQLSPRLLLRLAVWPVLCIAISV